MAKPKKMYVIDTNKPYDESDFRKSAWNGEGYPTKRIANEHLKYWKEHGYFVNENLTIRVEEAPAGW